MLPLSLPGGCAGVWRGSNSHFDQACFAAVAWAWCWGVFRLTCVVASCDVLPLLGWLVWRRAVLFIAWRVWWRAVSRLAFMVASHAVLTWRSGEGGGLILPALATSAPTLPSPPRHPGTARCAACRVGDRNLGCFCSSLHRWPVCSVFRVTPYSGAGAHGFARARGEPFRQSLLAVCGGRLTP